jgi:hypothetical protein
MEIMFEFEEVPGGIFQKADRRTVLSLGPAPRTVATILSTKKSDRNGGGICLVAVANAPL